MADAFDPDAYLATKSFDPDAYLAQGSAPAAPGGAPAASIASEKPSGIGPNFAAGFGEGVTGALGTLADMMNPVPAVEHLAADLRGPTLSDLVTGNKGTPYPPPAGQGYLNSILGKIGLNPESVEAKSFMDRLARYAGQGSTAVLVPGAGEAGAGAALGRAATGAISGIAGGEASEAAPDPIKPAVALFASLAAGIPLSMGASAIARVPGAVDRATTLARAGISSDAAERAAGTILAKNATDLPKVKDVLASGVGSDIQGPAVMQKVLGSDPTTFQATGDKGLGSLERSVAVKNPDLFKDTEEGQNTARVSALQGIQSGGNPAAVTDYFRGQLHDLDVKTASDISDRLNAARQSAAAIGGERPPEAIGADMRDAVASAEASTRQDERGLWKAVDPNRDLTGNTKLTSTNAGDIAKSMRPTEKPMDGEEAAIFDQAKNLPTVAPVSDLIALRSRTSTAMRDELVSNGKTPAYARLVQLRGAMQDNLAKTISDKVAAEAPQVASGEISAGDSISARVAQWRQNLEAQRDAFLAQRKAVVGGADAGDAAAPSPQLSPGRAAQTSEAPQPTFDAAGKARLDTATGATLARAKTYGLGPIGQILKSAGDQKTFRLPDAAVPAKFFHPGPMAFTDAQALDKAIGPERSLQLRTDAAAASLRKAAMKDDGTLDAAKVGNWQNRHADALRALPDAVRGQFSDARRASQALAEASAARVERLKNFQAEKVSQLLGTSTPEEVTNIVGQVFSSPKNTTLMKGLVDAVKGNPDAAEGLRQAVVDHISKRLISNTEVGTSGLSGLKEDAFQTFVKQAEPALRQVLKPADVDTIKAIAEDVRQAKRSQNAVRLKGGSNTAQDTFQVAKQQSMLSKIWREAAAVGVGSLFGPAGAVAGIVGAHGLQALREAGIDNIDKLVTKAMLDPVVARRLLEKAPAVGTPSPTWSNQFAKALRRSILPGVAVGANSSRGASK